MIRGLQAGCYGPFPGTAYQARHTYLVLLLITLLPRTFRQSMLGAIEHKQGYLLRHRRLLRIASSLATLCQAAGLESVMAPQDTPYSVCQAILR